MKNQTNAPASDTLTLDEAGLQAARSSLDDGAITPAYGPHREAIVKLLNDALATELVCVLRYKRHHFMASGLESPKIAEEFMVHATEEAAHADPDFSPSTLLQRSHADYDDSNDLQSMVRVNLIAERIAIEAYRQMISLLADKDPTTRRMLESILAQEEEHADELKDWLEP